MMMSGSILLEQLAQAACMIVTCAKRSVASMRLGAVASFL